MANTSTASTQAKRHSRAQSLLPNSPKTLPDFCQVLSLDVSGRVHVWVVREVPATLRDHNHGPSTRWIHLPGKDKYYSHLQSFELETRPSWGPHTRCVQYAHVSRYFVESCRDNFSNSDIFNISISRISKLPSIFELPSQRVFKFLELCMGH